MAKAGLIMEGAAPTTVLKKPASVKDEVADCTDASPETWLYRYNHEAQLAWRELAPHRLTGKSKPPRREPASRMEAVGDDMYAVWADGTRRIVAGLTRQHFEESQVSSLRPKQTVWEGGHITTQARLQVKKTGPR